MRKKFIPLFALGLLLQVGCQSGLVSAETQTPKAQIPLIQASSPQVDPPSLVPSSTAPLATPTPQRIMATPGPLVQTVSSEERFTLLRELALTQGECRLPCWLGIRPGLSRWSEVEKFVNYLNDDLDKKRQGEDGEYSFSISARDLETRIYGRAGAVDDVLSYLEFHLSTSEIVDVEAYHQTWRLLDPYHLFVEYGAPSQIWLSSLSWTRETRVGYELWLFYEEQQFMVFYNATILHQPVYEFCPWFGEGGNLQGANNTIRLVLISDLSEYTLADLSQMQRIILDSVKPIQEIANITPEEFHARAMEQGRLSCLQTRADFWP